jgi:TM2 domain-containing membrane protein YozV
MYSKNLAWILWALSALGPGGLHRFYLGKPLSGLLYLCTWNFLGVGLILDAFSLTDMVDAANARINAQLGPAGEARFLHAPDDSEAMKRALLRAAQTRNGMITVTEGVMATGRTFAEVQAELDSMLKSGYVSVDNHPTTGTVVYKFYELESQEPKT